MSLSTGSTTKDIIFPPSGPIETHSSWLSAASDGLVMTNKPDDEFVLATPERTPMAVKNKTK
jgi:hypothetical protein